MLELLEGLKAWQLLIVALAVYGFAPGVFVRFILLAYRRNDPIRAEIWAERKVVPRWDLPFWVADQAQNALFEGLLERIKSRLIRVLKSAGNVVFTIPFTREAGLSKKKYPQGTTGIVTRLHTGLLGEIRRVDVRLEDGNFVRNVPVDFFRP
jgi:hypothetical protein